MRYKYYSNRLDIPRNGGRRRKEEERGGKRRKEEEGGGAAVSCHNRNGLELKERDTFHRHKQIESVEIRFVSHAQIKPQKFFHDLSAPLFVTRYDLNIPFLWFQMGR